ncbi:MAG TPA: MFS transporter [Candidatus Limnocylindrales bacterium]
MKRLEAYVLLAVLGAGVFLAGLELMVTAVALPRIIPDLAAWTELRRASWIINAYLLVYVVTMPLAGRLTDLWGARRLFLAALAVFTVGSVLAGRAQSLDELIAARVVQAVGGGAIVPVATAAASHLFEGDARPRALGVVGALTFLGMAAGPFVGAAVLELLHPETALPSLGLSGGPLFHALAPGWRWVFYVNVPVGIVALVLTWAAGDWETPRHPVRLDLAGAALFSLALAAGLIALTLLGSTEPIAGVAPGTLITGLAVVATGAAGLFVAWGLRRRDPFLDPRLFRQSVFGAAALVSLLTGYGFLTAIVGGAVFVDRVLYGGPDQQRYVLGALAAATALGALASGLLVRTLSLRLVTLVGLLLSAGALWRMSGWQPATPIEEVAASMGVFGLGFGLTVTPRSTAAVEAAGQRLFGAASATVTVARHVGMAVGLAILTAYGSSTIDRLNHQVFATPEAYRSVLPAALRDRPLRDGLVVQALEEWASGQAAGIMVGLFLVAAGVTLVAIPPGLVLGTRRRMLTGTADAPVGAPGASGPGSGSDGRRGEADGDGGAEPIVL